MDGNSLQLGSGQGFDFEMAHNGAPFLFQAGKRAWFSGRSTGPPGSLVTLGAFTGNDVAFRFVFQRFRVDNLARRFNQAL
jgi:hypothetical protein